MSIWVILLSGAAVSLAGYNNLAATPPMGWRSWNQFGGGCNQASGCLERIANALVDKSRKVNGAYASLLQVGYTTVGLDDGWQACGTGYVPDNYTFHNASGFPLVNTKAYPNMHTLTAYIHSLGLRAGWYMDNCGCADVHCNSTSCYQGDVDAIKFYGWDDVKVDHCGGERDMTLWGKLIAASGLESVIENCGNGTPNGTYTTCSYHLYRISTDIRPTFGSTVNNAQPIRGAIASNSTGPGCWAYPDMLEVGVTNNHGKNVSTLNYTEARSHFGLWCVLSAPLTLGLNLTDGPTVDSVWDIITNTEAIAINQAWAGSPGGLLVETKDTTMLQHCDWHDDNCTLPVSQQWWKPLLNRSAAVIVLNIGNATLSSAVQFDSFPGNSLPCASTAQGCSVRDVWLHEDRGTFVGSYPVMLAPHDSALIVLS